MKKDLIRLTATAVGIALFTVLALALQVPVFQNYYLCLGYIAMAVYLYSFGAVSGTIVGVLGVVLYCVLTSGLRGMPGWALGNIPIGVIMGLTFAKTKALKSRTAKYAIWTAAAVIASAVGILGVKSLVDSLIKAQPFIMRAGMNIYAFIADAAVLIISLPVCVLLDKPAQKLLAKGRG